MNFTRIYNQLIEKSKNRTISGYSEKHHIVPKSMGGTNHKSNIVRLTAREHFIAHLLLWKIYKNPSMASAAWMLSYVNHQKINSRTFELLRIDHAANVRKTHTAKIVSAETRAKQSENRKGKPTIPKGYKFNLSEEERAKRSKSRKGKLVGEQNPMFREDVRLKHRLAISTEEYKKNHIEKRLGHKPTNFRRVSVKGVEYNSMVEASRSLGVTYNWIVRRVKYEKYTDYFYID